VALLPVNAVLRERAIRHAIYLQRLKAGYSKKVLDLLEKDVLAELRRLIQARASKIERLGTDTGPVTSARLNDIEENVRKLTGPKMRSTLKVLEGDMTSLVGTEAEWQVAALREAAPIDLSFNMPSPATLASLVSLKPMEGRVLGEWWRGLDRKIGDGVMRTLRTGIAIGKTSDDIVSDLIGARGPIEMAKRDARTLVRTATNSYANDARLATYKENSDVIKGYQFIATLDDRTTDICAALDGEVFDIDDEQHLPPMHWNCRSTTVPVTKSFEEMGIDADELPPGERSSMDGQVPETQTYSDFLKGQDEAFQNDVLGEERADIFRTGKVPLAKFIDDQSRPLSLDDLRALESLPPPTPTPEPTPQPVVVAPSPISEAMPPPPPSPSDDIENIQLLLDTIRREREAISKQRGVAAGEYEATLGRVKYLGATEPIGSKVLDEALTDATKAKIKLDRLGEMEREAIHRAMTIPESQRASINLSTRLKSHPEMVDRAQTAARFIESLWKKKTPKQSLTVYLKKSVRRDGQRYSATAKPWSREVFLKPDSPISTAVHEIAHILETDPALKRDIRAFFERKTAGRKSEWLGKGYDKNEVAFKGVFMHDYMGKDTALGYTELVSMGFEWLYKNPQQLLSREPELFELLVKWLRVGRK
jgi:SPP1 gp7 family putative phage head morphogenesis protein